MRRSLALPLLVLGMFRGSAYAQINLSINGTTYSYCAAENQRCSFSGTALVVFGTTSPSLMYDINGPFTNNWLRVSIEIVVALLTDYE